MQTVRISFVILVVNIFEKFPDLPVFKTRPTKMSYRLIIDQRSYFKKLKKKQAQSKFCMSPGKANGLNGESQFHELFRVFIFEFHDLDDARPIYWSNKLALR